MEEIAKPTGGELVTVNVAGGIDWAVGDQLMSDRGDLCTIGPAAGRGRRPRRDGRPTIILGLNSAKVW